jgi:DNA-binding NarL/FixJ family response regulator
MFYAQNRPDMLITEIHFPNTPVTGLDAMEKLKQEMPESRVIIFTGENNPSFLARASVLGADDYVDKNGNTDELLSAILRIHAGEERQPQHRLNQISAAMKKKRTHQESGIPLTDREIQVLRHIAFGMSNREIARSLKISDETIKEHVQNILRKIGLRDRTQAAVWAVRKKVI